MSKKFLFIFAVYFFALAAPATVCGQASATTAVGYPRTQNQRLAIGALRQIFAAQKTYFATVGNGTYGSLTELSEAGLIDPVLASGYKFGFEFMMEIRDPSKMSPALFRAVAFPSKFGFRISGYIINEQGLLILISRESERAVNALK